MLINQWVINRTFLILGLKPAMWVKIDFVDNGLLPLKL